MTRLAAKGDQFGTHRSLFPLGSLPQPAERLDNDFSRLYSGEMLLSVETLNIDAASFRQMEEALPRRPVEDRILETVAARGKQHNPVTGSGGMLLGTVKEMTEGHPDKDRLSVGTRVASLVSLSLTPLRVDRIRAVRPASAQVDIDGEAVLFASGAYAVLPEDLPERLALAVLDVAGAAPQVARLVEPGQVVLILGAGGKSGLLCAQEARRILGTNGIVIGVESFPTYAEEARGLGLYDHVIDADARDPVAIRNAVLSRTAGREADVSFSCVNVTDAEAAALLSTRDRGKVYFFAMSTSFSKAALGAEGLGKDVDLLIGNGFAHGHADHSLQLMRDFPKLRVLFERRYG